ncbi:MAG: hydroxymethylbilane synthase [Candidatus Hadarchaeales archaeon]
MKVRIGTRGSRLALAQTQRVIKKLKAVAPKLKPEVMVIRTSGDAGLRKKPGAFVNEINMALLEGKIDIGVHSLKDLPTKLPGGVVLACVPERLRPNDALVSRENTDIWKLPSGAVIGTDSPRRVAELSSLRPDLKFKEIRGNVDTRIRKIEDGIYDATVVALAALERLGLNRAAQIFKLDEVVPAVGQGALAITARVDMIYPFLKKINDQKAWIETTCERVFLESLGGGCKSGAGAVARVMNGKIQLICVVHRGGRRLLKLTGSDPVELGRKAGVMLCQARST